MLTASNESSATKDSNDAVMTSKGLTQEEVLKRREKFGYNQIETPKGESAFLKFIRHFISLMAILLWVGGFVAFFLYRHTTAWDCNLARKCHQWSI